MCWLWTYGTSREIAFLFLFLFLSISTLAYEMFTKDFLTSCQQVGEGKDSKSGSKKSTKKVVEYCYEAEMEEVVQFFLFSLLVSFGANVN